MFSAKQIDRMDAIRGFAALYVAFTHGHAVFRTPLKALGGFGGEGVALFFLLSGLVIGGSLMRGGTPDWKRYFVHRFRRIWPPFLVALLLAWVVQSLVLRDVAPLRGFELLGNLAMLQDQARPGGIVWSYHQNWPLWSLSYEWWYYMLIPLIWLVPQARRADVVVGVSIVSAIVYRVHPFGPLAYLGCWYLWWAGLELAREVHRTGTVSWKGQWGNMFRMGLVVAAWAPGVVLAVLRHERLMPAEDPFLPMRHCGGGLVLLGLGVLWAKSGWKGFDATIGHFARFAPVSYAVYLFHFPLFTLAGAWFPDLHEAVRFLPVMVATLALAWIVERKLQPLVNMAADRFLLRKS
jgi:peptidoglycan/LPS O-acetylase OafA/YrhL